MTNEYKFKQIVKGQNFMTPNIIRYGQQGDYLYELSVGVGLYSNEMVGVTVVDLRTNEHRHDLSQLFTERSLAEDYINDLEKQA